MAAMDGTAVLAEINGRLNALEAGMTEVSNVVPRVAQIEMQIAGNVSAINNVVTKIQEMEAQTAGIIDMKIAAAIAVMTATGGMQTTPQHTNWGTRSILESKAIQDIDRVVDAKGYRQWNRKMKNALEQTRQKSRPALEMLEKMTEEMIQEKQEAEGMLTKKGAIIDIMKNKYGGNEQDTEDNIRGIEQGPLVHPQRQG